jgi:hypothetical protein
MSQLQRENIFPLFYPISVGKIIEKSSITAIGLAAANVRRSYRRFRCVPAQRNLLDN